MRLKIEDSLIDSVILLIPRPWFLRYDTCPFLIIYPLLMLLYFNQSNKMLILILLSIALSLQVLLFLLMQFNIEIKCFIGYRQTSNVQQAIKLLILPKKNIGNHKIVELNQTNTPTKPFKIIGTKFSSSSISFEFQKTVYQFNETTQSFNQLTYPCQATIRDYSQSNGYLSETDLQAATEHWKKNEFEIPSPDFLDIFSEHLIAPFFLFQVICLFLWSLDDYWLYSVLTFAMLLVFEGILAQQRLLSLQMLRRMRKDPFFLYVYRMGQWHVNVSDRLLPGDIISLTSTTTASSTSSTTTTQSKTGGRNGMKESQSKGMTEKYVPCDCVIIRGNCLVNEALLTGESVPQLKESIRTFTEEDDNNDNQHDSQNALDSVINLGNESDPHPIWRRFMVFGGSVVSQHCEKSTEEDTIAKSKNISSKIPLAPDGGCQAVVVRTSFGTIQGGLMRKILFTSERVTINSQETYLFIGILLIFALISSSVVLMKGLQDPHRNLFKLILHCIMIVTSVVPPELPMELSVAVTNSLAILAKELIYCVEPYRIPLAGRIDVLCFDKTGTLTQDRMELKGIVNPQNIPELQTKESLKLKEDILKEIDEVQSSIPLLFDPDDCDVGVLIGLASCQSLIYSRNGTIIGDPLEEECFQHSGFQVVPPSSNQSSSTLFGSHLSSTEKGITIQILHRYQFSSILKRMSVIADITSTRSSSSPHSNRIIFTKGAPEVLYSLFDSPPSNYESIYLSHMKLGRRVLALGYRLLDSSSPSPFQSQSQLSTLSRNVVESHLKFLGFLVFNSSLKPETKSTIKELKNLSKPFKIITGDNVFTTIEISKKLSILSKDKEILILEESSSTVHWKVVRMDGSGKSSPSPSSESIIPFDSNNLTQLSQSYSLCLTCSTLSFLENSSSKLHSDASFIQFLHRLCCVVTIFSRVNPIQKELILKSLNQNGLVTLYCGDGTNDCGALKEAHVGVSIINDPEFETAVQNSFNSQDNRMKSSKKQARELRSQIELQHQKDQPQIVKLGDASIASSFTVKQTTIHCLLAIVRQGQCTLITTIQIYKILALNCLSSAFLMSIFYFQGLKHGETQMTVVGLTTASLFYFISTSKSAPHLSNQRPSTTIFQMSNLLSIFGQFLCHILSFLLILYLCDNFNNFNNSSSSDEMTTMIRIDRSIVDSKFHPSLMNSSVYLLSFTIQLNNFLINYRGQPFLQSLTENRPFCLTLQAYYCFLLILWSGMIQPLNDLLQLVLFPSVEFQYLLGGVLIGNFCFCYGIEKYLHRYE